MRAGREIPRRTVAYVAPDGGSHGPV